MMLTTRVPLTAMLVGTLLVTGCGKTDDQPTRFNKTLGDTPTGAPVSTGPIDTGILQDPAGYKPTAYDSLEGGPPSDTASGAEGAEVEAIRGMLSDLMEAAFDLDFETVLDAFVPGQVAALVQEDEYMANLNEMADALRGFWQVLVDKAGGSDSEAMASLEALLPDLVGPVTNAVNVAVVDEENAEATFNPARLEIPQDLLTTLTELAQMGAASPDGEPGAEPAAGGFTPDMLDNLPSVEISLPLRKVENVWRLELPFTIEEQHAELIGEGALLFKDYLTEIAQAFDQAETLDEQTARQIATQVGLRHGPAIAGWSARVKLAWVLLMETQPQPEDEAADAETDEAEETSEEESERRPSRRPSRRP